MFRKISEATLEMCEIMFMVKYKVRCAKRECQFGILRFYFYLVQTKQNSASFHNIQQFNDKGTQLQ